MVYIRVSIPRTSRLKEIWHCSQIRLASSCHLKAENVISEKCDNKLFYATNPIC